METFTLEPEEDCVWLWGHSVYPDDSVLAGETRRRRVECFDTLEQARTAYPNVEILEAAWSHRANRADMSSFMRSPAPADFDPADAGEEW